MSSLPGVAGQGLRVCGLRARVRCLRACGVCVRAACMRAGAVLACVRLRACARGAAHDSYTFCDGHSEDV